MLTDSQIEEVEQAFAQMLTGDERPASKAFERIQRLLERRFFGHLLGHGVPEQDCEEILSDLFLAIWKLRNAPPRIESRAHAYFWGMCHNRYVDWRRSRKREPPVDEIDESIAEDPQQRRSFITEEQDNCEQRQFERFRELEPERARVLELAVYQGQNLKDVAIAIGRTYRATIEFLSKTREKYQQFIRSQCDEWIAA